MKIKNITAIILAAALVALSVPMLLAIPASADSWDGQSIASGFSGGEGTEASPYLIGSATELAYLSKNYNDITNADSSPVYYKLTTDINLQDNEWTPIGYRVKDKPFTGVFDGDNHTVSGLKVSTVPSSTQDNGGLFGGVSECTIKNLKVTGSLCSGTYVGGIAGYAYNNCKFINCRTKIDNIDGFAVGGIVGRLDTGTNEITGCVSDSTIVITTNVESKDIFAGGIVGVAGGTTISYCGSNSDISIAPERETSAKKAVLLGGIIGCQGASSAPTHIKYCYSTGTIVSRADVAKESSNFAGGISGRAGHVAGGSITNCFTTATIKFTKDAQTSETTSDEDTFYGSIAGHCKNAMTFADCYALDEHFIGTDAQNVDTTLFKKLSLIEMQGDAALVNMNLGTTAEGEIAAAIEDSVLYANYYHEEITAMEAYTNGKAMMDYMTEFVATNYDAGITGGAWVANAGDIPTVGNYEAAVKLSGIQSAVKALIAEEFDRLYALYKADNPDTTVADDEPTNTNTPQTNTTTKVPNNTSAPSTNAPASDNNPGGCGGITTVAAVVAVLIGGAAFVVVKKKY